MASYYYPERSKLAPAASGNRAVKRGWLQCIPGAAGVFWITYFAAWGCAFILIY